MENAQRGGPRPHPFFSAAGLSSPHRTYQSAGVITLDEMSARPPRIVAWDKVSGGPFQLSGTGPRGASFRLLLATKPALSAGPWTQVGTGRFAGGVFTLGDSRATNRPAGLYRVAVP